MTSKQICPLCQAQNNCQITDSTTSCWCTTFTFPESLNEKLKELPEECICFTCAKNFGATKK